MSNSPASPGPDLFFAGGECLTRFGVWVRRTDMDLEAATRETATRATTGNAMGRDSFERDWAIDEPRAEWLNEVDLDPTRNLTNSTHIQAWDQNSGCETETVVDGRQYKVTDPSDISLSFARITNTNQSLNGDDIRVRCYVKKTREEAATVSVRYSDVGILLDPFTTNFSVVGGPVDVVRYRDGNWIVMEWTVAGSTQANPQWQVYPAFATAGELTGLSDSGAVGTVEVKNLQAEYGADATAFQVMPRDRDRKFPSLILEATSFNSFLRSQEFDDPAWTKTRTTVQANQRQDPKGSTTGDRLLEDATPNSSHRISQNVSGLAAGVDQALSIYVQRVSGVRRWFSITTNYPSAERTFFDILTGRVGIQAAGHSQASIERVSTEDEWYRCSITANTGAVTQGTVEFNICDDDGSVDYDGDGTSGFYIWGAQLDPNLPVTTSPIVSGGTTTIRQADNFFAPYLAPPQDFTVYAKFLESGSGIGPEAGIFHIGGPTIVDDPRFLVFSSAAGGYFLQYDDGVTNLATPSPTPEPALRDVVEHVAILQQDGSAFSLEQYLNGAFSDLQEVWLANTRLKSAWAAPTIFINSEANTQTGFNRFLAVKVHRGVRSIDFMRAL